MARKKLTRALAVHLTAEHREQAIRSSSGGCLIADAIQRQYPHLSAISVDMATTRATDRKNGERIFWLTPPSAQHALLSFDQGWSDLVGELTFSRPIKVTPVIAGRKSTAQRQARLRELEAKVEAGEKLTRSETHSLAMLRKSPVRSHKRGPAEMRGGIVIGGQPLPQGAAHPNLLRGRNRHFGAKLADPGVIFEEAVAAAVTERLAAEQAS